VKAAGLALLAGLLAGLLARPARAETLVTSLSTNRVLIASNYTGADVVMFGAIERDAGTVARSGGFELVITVRGPRSSIVVREKDRAGPIFVNQDRRKFPDAPGYLAVLSTSPVEAIASEDLRERLRLGLESVIIGPDSALPALQEEFRRFGEALIRLKESQNLYQEDEKGVEFLAPNLFRATIPLPAAAPLGRYEVETRLFSQGSPLAVVQSSFEVEKTGFEAYVAQAARTRPFLYGLCVILTALASGWIASVIFRRD